jgi:hypothetical protein
MRWSAASMARGMDAHRLVRLVGRKGRHDEASEEIAVGDVLEGLCAIGASRSGTGRAMPRLPEGGDTPQRSEIGTPIRSRSDVASQPGSTTVRGPCFRASRPN